MAKWLTIFLVLCGVMFGGCKKGRNAQNTSPLLNPSAAPIATAPPRPTPPPTPSKPAIDQNAQVIVFGYHRFEKKVKRPDTEITPEAFENQMKELQTRKIAVIPMQDFLAWKRGEKAIPSRAAIITIDDGYKSGYEVAWPILKKYGYPFTLFIYTEGVRGGKFGGGQAMTWEQLAEMRDAGIDIEAHSATHQDLRKLPPKLKSSGLNYDQWLDSEIAGSKQTLEQKLGIQVNCFAVPFGYYNEKVRAAAKKARFEALFTVYGQKLTYGSPNDSLGRYMMEANKPKVFTEAINFGGGASGGSAPVEEIPTASLQASPADGAVVSDKTPLIQANLGGLATLDPGSAKMRVSGMGLVPAKFDPRTKIISYQITQPLHGDTCTVIVEAKSAGKKLEAHWTFTLQEAAVRAKDAIPSPAPSGAPKK